MTPERWQRICEIFDGSLCRPPDEVDGFVARACEGDSILYRDVRRMLDEHASTKSLQGPVPPPLDSPLPAFPPGEQLANRYRIVRFIARGGMGEVYEAEDLELHERVALKTVLPAIAADTAMIARFKREIQLSRRIVHPGICRVFDLNIHNGSTLFLTMEYLEGETLEGLLRREAPLNIDAALPLLSQMAEALGAAHQTGIIHRDFKPANVILSGNRAVVTDFGIARSIASGGGETATETGLIIGTLDYMAPEVLAGYPAGIASDVYALGITAYRMLAGSLPFAGEKPVSAAYRRATEPIPPVPGIPPHCQAAILRSLDADPSKRFASTAEFNKALQQEQVRTVSAASFLPARIRLAIAALLLPLAGWLCWRMWDRGSYRPSPEAFRLYRTGTEDLHAGANFAAAKALQQAIRTAPEFALAHARLAEAMMELDMPEKAGQEMLLARRADPSSLSSLDRLHLDAVDLSITREFAAAAARYEQMLPRAAGEKPELYVDLGRVWEKAENPAKAKESYRSAAQGPVRNPAAWLRLAVLEGQAARQAEADEAFRQAEEIYEATSNLEGLTEVALQRGIAANRRGQLPEAATYLRKALDTARVTGNVHQEIFTKLQLGTNAFLAGGAGAAESYSREALESAQANQMEAPAIRGLLNIGNAHFRKTDYAGAEKLYAEALAMARRINSRRLAANALLSLGALHDRLSRSDESAREAAEALTFWEANRFTRETSQCLTLLGRAQRNRGEYPAALATFSRLLAFAEKLGDRLQMALAHESIGGLFVTEERYPEALAHYEQALALATDPQHAGYAAVQCGFVLWRLGRYTEAQGRFQSAEAPAAKFTGLRLDLLRFRAEMLLSQGRFAEAAATARRLRAEAGQDRPTLAEAERVLGLAVLNLGDRSAGRNLCESALGAQASLRDAGSRHEARMAAAEARLETGDSTGAASLLRDMEPELAGLPDSHWRLSAFLARADRGSAVQHAANARRVLDELSHAWGEAVFRTYLARPDLQKLFRSLTSPSTSISQKERPR